MVWISQVVYGALQQKSWAPNPIRSQTCHLLRLGQNPNDSQYRTQVPRYNLEKLKSRHGNAIVVPDPDYQGISHLEFVNVQDFCGKVWLVKASR